jgi:hypothetical protein
MWKCKFNCPTGAALSGTITDITLWKNSTSGWKEIVKIWLKIENGLGVNEITWTNTDVRNRYTFTTDTNWTTISTDRTFVVSLVWILDVDRTYFNLQTGFVAWINFLIINIGTTPYISVNPFNFINKYTIINRKLYWIYR